MNKSHFLKELKFALKDLSSLEIDDILKDYEDHFNFGIEEGKTEEEISLSLGDPKEIAKEILSNYNIKKSNITLFEPYVSSSDLSKTNNVNSRSSSNTNENNFIKSILVAIALFFFNLIFILGPAIGILGALLGIWIVAIVFLISPILVIFKAILTVNLFEIFFSLFLCGLGLFLAIGLFFTTKFLFKLILKYIKLNINLIFGGK